ncbi:hypothetical protein AK812_SmicGene614 [Symbiodinium microadriaticum]|uniref:Uncharacterized protein n=1 Tax=Symbiodinium microadriaticum TaxID=2951 RepID=A0A1Q9F675_SYMMI|nr:hypothetical protein AK812_SmicGene614 [Symbiodinium microadriaticum]
MAVTNIFVTVFDFTTWTVPRGLPRGHMAPPNAILHAKHKKNIQGFLQDVTLNPNKLTLVVDFWRKHEGL